MLSPTQTPTPFIIHMGIFVVQCDNNNRVHLQTEILKTYQLHCILAITYKLLNCSHFCLQCFKNENVLHQLSTANKCNSGNFVALVCLYVSNIIQKVVNRF